MLQIEQLTRRSLLRTALPALIVPSMLPTATLFAEAGNTLPAQWAALEKKSGGRLGCTLLDTATGRKISHRGGERFPMCSTFKLLAVAFILQRVNQGREQFDRRITFTRADILSYAPVTKDHADGSGMTIRELCAAVIIMSDNTAANLLLATFGGPPALTEFLRSLGDPTTRLDRTEPTLNEATPGDPRDTTTPEAMADTIQRILLGNLLSAESRTQLTDWLIDCQTGQKKLRAHLPAGWKAGDKTGSGENNTSNDVAILWPPNRKPLILTAYLTQSTLDSDATNAILADVGKSVFEKFR